MPHHPFISYKKGDLFSAKLEKGVALVHAVNCKGVWGSGVARGFRDRFPDAYRQYQARCSGAESPLGTAQLYPNNTSVAGGYIGCLFTSYGYGFTVDSPISILGRTATAISDLLYYAQLHDITTIHSPKFNSGLFNVSWEHTANVLEANLTMAHWRPTWVVWEP